MAVELKSNDIGKRYLSMSGDTITLIAYKDSDEMPFAGTTTSGRINKYNSKGWINPNSGEVMGTLIEDLDSGIKTRNALVRQFTIEPMRDIKPYFTKEKEVQIDAANIKGCLFCGGSNCENLKSSAWTRVQNCWECEHVNVVYYADRMGGSYLDTVISYIEKEVK